MATATELPIRVNPELEIFERETHFYINDREQDKLKIHTDNPTVMKYLRKLADKYNDAVIEHETIRKVNGKKAVVSMMAEISSKHLALKGKQRKASGMAQIVN